MKALSKSITLLGVLLLSLSQSTWAQSDESFLEFSGFSRLVVGYLDEEHAELEGYDDSLSIGQRSLLAIQIDAHLHDKLSLTTQLLAHSSDTRDSGIEWLYLTYKPFQSTRIKAGLLRTPFFAYSEILDVGFAYPWVSPQQQVYNAFVFDQYEGLSFSYQFPTPQLNIEFEAYLGTFEDKVQIAEEFEANRFLDAQAKVFRGLAMTIKKDQWTARASFYELDLRIDYPEFIAFRSILDALAYHRTADSLDTNGATEINEIALFYDDFDYFFKSEVIRIKSDSISVPTINSFYVSAGYISYPFTYHATFADNHSVYPEAVSEIPLGLDPQIDFLRGEYRRVFEILPVDSLSSYTVGVRWDFAPNMALKFDATRLEGNKGQRSFFRITDTERFDHSANLYELAWEWVF